MELHADCAHLGFLLGTWRGRGRGEYPTIESFEYLEEVTIGHVGKPFLAYTQKTRHADTGLPLHAEAGYLRPDGHGGAELVVVQPSGIVEVHAGTVDGTTVDLRSTDVLTTPTAKSVTAVHRHIEVEGESLSYRVAMAAVGEPLTHHLAATLNRAVSES